MDYIALLAYLLAFLAIGYFALEFIFTGLGGRVCASAMALIRR